MQEKQQPMIFAIEKICFGANRHILAFLLFCMIDTRQVHK